MYIKSNPKMGVNKLERLSRFIDSLQRIFSLRRTKITLYIAAVLWIAVLTQIVMNKAFFKDFEIAEAFVKTNTEDLECSLEIVAKHNKDFLSETDKKDILHHIADSIGLSIDTDIAINREDERTEYVYHKPAKMAETTLKIVSLEQEVDSKIQLKHYIIVRLNIRKSIRSIEKYRSRIEKSLDDLGIAERQVTMIYEGMVIGRMTDEDKENLAQLLVKELQGEVAFDYRQGDSYTTYAYTGLINDYIETVGCKINIQIAITYDEQLGRTKIYLASPAINQSW